MAGKNKQTKVTLLVHRICASSYVTCFSSDEILHKSSCFDFHVSLSALSSFCRFSNYDITQYLTLILTNCMLPPSTLLERVDHLLRVTSLLRHCRHLQQYSIQYDYCILKYIMPLYTHSYSQLPTQ